MSKPHHSCWLYMCHQQKVHSLILDFTIGWLNDIKHIDHTASNNVYTFSMVVQCFICSVLYFEWHLNFTTNTKIISCNLYTSYTYDAKYQNVGTFKWDILLEWNFINHKYVVDVSRDVIISIWDFLFTLQCQMSVKLHKDFFAFLEIWFV